MEKSSALVKPYPGTIRLDSKCYAPPRPRRRDTAATTIAGNISMSTIAQSPEHSSMNHSMGSFLNDGRDTLLPADFDAMSSRRSTVADAGNSKRKSPVSESKDAAIKKKAKPAAVPTRRSKRVASAPRPDYTSDGSAEGEQPSQANDDDEENDEEQARRQNVTDESPRKSITAPVRRSAARQSFRSTRSRRR